MKFKKASQFMVDFRITHTLLMQSQPPKSPLSGDFEDFGKDRVIDKGQLISIIHHSFRLILSIVDTFY